MTTVAATPEQLGFGGYSLNTYAAMITQITGLDEFPALRGDNSPLAGLHGSRWLQKTYDEKDFDVAIFVSSRDANNGQTGSNRAQLRANYDALVAILGVRSGQQLLTRVMPDGTTRQVMAEVKAVRNFVDQANMEAATLVVTFEHTDPFWYGSVPVTDSRVITNGMSYNFTPGGSLTGRNGTITIAGTITNPTVNNFTTGALAVWTGALAGRTLLIDPYNGLVTVDGANAMTAFSWAVMTEMFLFAPGANLISVTGSGIASSPTIALSVSPAFL